MRDEITIPYNTLSLISGAALIVSFIYELEIAGLISAFLLGYSLKTISAACMCKKEDN